MAPAPVRVRRSLTALTAAGCLLLAAPLAAGAAVPGSSGVPAPEAGTPTNGESWAEETLAGMSLEEKVGQLFVTYVHGETADTTDPEDVALNQEHLGVDNGREAIERYGLGGIIYFTWSDNLTGPEQIAELSNGLQEAASESASGVPLLVTTDQEHGAVTRIAEPATRLPGSMALGASGDAGDAWVAARLAGQELRAMGVTMNHAPAADVNVNPANPVIGVRSFSSDPRLTATLTAAQVAGYQEGTDGVVASTKHFPGHGNTDVDSHHDLPVITHTLEEWREIDAPPFQAAVAAGTGAVMTGHLRFPELDPSGDPATLSEPIMNGLLRGELGYDGVVITDSLLMEGVRQQYPDEEIPVRALQAGVDLLLMPPDLDGAFHAVLDAVAEGELTEERIDTSVSRVLELKEEQGLVTDPYVDPERAVEFVGAPEHHERAQAVTDRTTTLVTNDDGALPLDPDRAGRVLVTGPDERAVTELASRVDARAEAATALPVDADPDDERIAEVVAAAARHDTVLVATSDAGGDGQAALVDAVLTDSGTPLVTLSLDVPYDIAAYPDVPAHLALYSAVPAALESAARVLFGESAPVGSLPVTVPTADGEGVLYPIGHGLGYGAPGVHDTTDGADRTDGDDRAGNRSPNGDS